MTATDKNGQVGSGHFLTVPLYNPHLHPLTHEGPAAGKQGNIEKSS